MSGKRVNDAESFANIQTLNLLINEWTSELEPIVGKRCREYITLRPSWSWNELQLTELLTLVRYEVATMHLAKSLDQFREDTDFNDERQRKRFLDISRALNSALRDTQTLRGSLGLTVAQTQGDLRALKTAKHKELQLRDISIDSGIRVTDVTDINQARERAKEMLSNNLATDKKVNTT